MPTFMLILALFGVHFPVILQEKNPKSPYSVGLAWVFISPKHFLLRTRRELTVKLCPHFSQIWHFPIFSWREISGTEIDGDDILQNPNLAQEGQINL